MNANPRLWIVTLDVPVHLANATLDVLGEGAVAETTIAPPHAVRAIVEAIFDSKPDIVSLQMRLAIFSAMIGTALPTPTVRPSPNIDWLIKVAEDFPPVKIGCWVVHGAYHRSVVPNRLLALQIDATSAFGTGGHPSTHGCLLMLHKILKTGFHPRRVLDIGCGSGILSIACVKAVCGQAVAVDLDPLCVQIAMRNARVNGVAGKVQVRQSRGYGAPLIRRQAPYDLIMTNLFTKPLCQMAKDVKKYLRPGGIAILAGVLTPDAGRIISAHRRQGLTLIEHTKISDWSVLALRRQHRAL